MKLWNKLAQDARLIYVLVVANVVQFVIIIGLLVCIVLIPTRFTFHIPPDITNGATLHPHKIPKTYVGQFAFFIWQVLNNWQTNGATDAKMSLARYGAYLSPSFNYAIQKTDSRLKASGQLQGRTRTIRPVNGSDPAVVQLNANTWQVILKVRLSEYNNGVLIKDKEIEYPFKVIRYNGNAQVNPYGLVLDGFTSTPVLLKTYK